MNHEDKVGIFKAVAGLVIVDNQNQVLITQRSLTRKHHPGEWEITSGRVDKGEGFEDAAHREAKEELDITIDIIIPLRTFHFLHNANSDEHLGVAFLCKIKEGIVKVDGIEEVAYKWASFEDALSLIKDKDIQESLKAAHLYLRN